MFVSVWDWLVTCPGCKILVAWDEDVKENGWMELIHKILQPWLFCENESRCFQNGNATHFPLNEWFSGIFTEVEMVSPLLRADLVIVTILTNDVPYTAIVMFDFLFSIFWQTFNTFLKEAWKIQIMEMIEGIIIKPRPLLKRKKGTHEPVFHKRHKTNHCRDTT